MVRVRYLAHAIVPCEIGNESESPAFQRRAFLCSVICVATAGQRLNESREFASFDQCTPAEFSALETAIGNCRVEGGLA